MKFLAGLFVILLAACGDRAPAPPSDWKTWAAWAETRYPISDPEGHGPDVGSDEWAMALSRRLGVIDADGHGPDIGSVEWRSSVESKLRN